jgi:hypothetical protein
MEQVPASRWGGISGLGSVCVQAGVDRGTYHPGQDLQTRQQVAADAVRAGASYRAGALTARGETGSVALD